MLQKPTVNELVTSFEFAAQLIRLSLRSYVMNLWTEAGAMPRFFFGLLGGKNIEDPWGLPLHNELVAFRAGQKLAEEISNVRPQLQGNTCVVISRNDKREAYYIGIPILD